MNNATRKTRRDHERALRAEQTRIRNLTKKQARLLTLGRTREQRKPQLVRDLTLRQKEIAALAGIIRTKLEEFDRTCPGLFIQAQGGPYVRPGEVSTHATR